MAVSDEQMVKVARAAETVCADSINTPLLGKKNFWSEPFSGSKGPTARTELAFWLGMTEKSPLMRAVAAILLFVSGITAEAETADKIFINGNIYTVNEKQPDAEAIAVDHESLESPAVVQH